MKPTHKLIALVLAHLTLVPGTFAQQPSAREQFQVAVTEYQKSSTRETALKVIDLAKQLDPPPAVPEEAREPFIMGATVLREAGGPAAAAKAVELFTQAVHIAPWWPEARYNRALAHEAAGQFDAANQDLKLYLSFNLKEDERREAQDKIYALKAKAQLAADKQAELDKVTRAEAAVRQAAQAKRDVITAIRNAVNNRSYTGKIPSYGKRDADVWGGVNNYELFGGGTYYLHQFYPNLIWKFSDEKAELWSVESNGKQSLVVLGESGGSNPSDMRWFTATFANTKSETQVWAYFDLRNGYFYSSSVGGGRMRPLRESEFDPNMRYNYYLFRPAQ